MLLKKALYGHPDSGTFWETHCNRAVLRAGFQEIEAWPSCFFHPQLKLFLVIYVDDFKMSGPKDALSKGWGLIRKGLHLEGPAPVHLYLGCVRQLAVIQTAKSKKTPALVYNMESQLKAVVERYCNLVRDMTGKAPALRLVSTPFITEDQHESPGPRPKVGRELLVALGVVFRSIPRSRALAILLSRASHALVALLPRARRRRRSKKRPRSRTKTEVVCSPLLLQSSWAFFTRPAWLDTIFCVRCVVWHVS